VGENKIISLLMKPQYLFLMLGHRGFFNWMSDETYLKIAFWCKMGKRLNLKHPTTYNEKLQWLKLNDRNPEYTNLADKYEVRKFIEKTIGGEYLIPLFGIWDSVDEIDFDKLPNQFVLKCTHDSGGLVICTDKRNFNIDKAKRKIRKSLKHNYYWGQREWIYKNIKPRIIAEKYMTDGSNKRLKDYKFFCFDGEVKAMFIATDRGIDTRFDFFDLNFNHLPFMQHYPNANSPITKPKGFEEMIELAKVLSKGIKHVRVDFYDINGKVYFGEMTFFHFSGWEKFKPDKYDQIFGEWLQIPVH
jgi:hypothetical protein